MYNCMYHRICKKTVTFNQMGNKQSVCRADDIVNVASRRFFESIERKKQIIPQNIVDSSDFQRLMSVLFESLKLIPENEPNLSLRITGRGMGPLFVDHLLLKIEFPMSFTKVSLRKSSLKAKDIISLCDLLNCITTIKEFDASDNDFGESVTNLFDAALLHPNLCLLQLENCGINENCVASLSNLIKYNRRITDLRVSPVKMTKYMLQQLANDLNNNYTLKACDISPKLSQVSDPVVKRNIAIFDIVKIFKESPFDPLYGTKCNSYKSIKGREMLFGRAREKQLAQGTDKYKMYEESDQKALLMQNDERPTKDYYLRCAHAEMCGYRDRMEDVSVIMNDFPAKGAMLFGLFDGHGGREAAEYASQHLPFEIKKRLEQSKKIKAAYVGAFQQIHSRMRPQFIYVGTTAVIAVVHMGCLTVASVGDSRCVLCRNRKAVRLTTDHKPDIPEEQQYIESKGGIVQGGRVSGMLAVSRALGDGLFNELVNPTPSFTYGKLSEDDSFMILACDGVWDVMKDQEAVDLIATEIDPLVAAKKIRDKAYEKHSQDNISVIVVFLADAIARANNVNA